MQLEVQLKHEAQHARELKRRLTERFPDIDDDTLADTLEGLTDVQELIGELVRSALVDQALMAGLKGRIDDMRQRLTRLDGRAAKKRALALTAMTEVGLKTVTQPDFTATARAGTPAVIVISEDRIPDDFWVPQPAKLDRHSLGTALKRGKDIPGATLSNPEPVLSVRTK